jgi:hypothetical protein
VSAVPSTRAPTSVGGGPRRRLRLLFRRVEFVHLHVAVRPVEQVTLPIRGNAEGVQISVIE